MHILALAGSLRAASTNIALLEALARSPPRGMEVEIYRGLGMLPIFNPDREGGGDAGPRARSRRTGR